MQFDGACEGTMLNKNREGGATFPIYQYRDELYLNQQFQPRLYEFMCVTALNSLSP